MLANIWLKREGSEPTLWPEEVIGAEGTLRQEYIQAVRAADDEKFEALISLHSKYTRM